MQKIQPESVNKILVIKLRGIGDVILSTVVFDNLQENFPSASIDFLTEGASIPALEKLPSVNKIHKFNRKKTWEQVKLAFKIRRERYDLVIDLFSNPSTAQITKLSGAKYRVGFPYKGRKYAYNIFGPEERDKFHSADLHLELLKYAGIMVSSNSLYFGLAESDNIIKDQFFSSNNLNNNLVIGISPSGGWESKKCEPEKFASVADKLVDKYSAKIVIVWGPGDEEDAAQIIAQMKNEAILAPPTSIREMGALISGCNILIANDSGPMHISAAIGTPTLSINGPTNPRLQGPYGSKHEWIRLDELECIECNLLECPRNHECFKDLLDDNIIEKVDLLIKKNNILPLTK